MKLRKKTPNIRVTYMDGTDKHIKFFSEIANIRSRYQHLLERDLK